jgi:aminopeptidase
MPDGEIYTAPVEESVSGRILFEFPGFFGEQKIEGIRLTFRDGEVVEAAASTNEELLHEVLATDDGARRIGEFGVGTNNGIGRFFGDILYDEKIGGTIHLALGRSYGECGGRNDSALHWDLIKDLRQSGSIELDGKEMFRNGRWLFQL